MFLEYEVFVLWGATPLQEVPEPPLPGVNTQFVYSGAHSPAGAP